MKCFAIVAVLLCLAVALVRADEPKVASGYGGGSYGVPSPPCPKNYMFGCQPSLQKVPCASGGYGGSGSYSENSPVYTMQVPQFIHGFQTY